MQDLKKLHEIGEFALRLKVYKNTLILGFSLYLFGMLIAGSLIVVNSLIDMNLVNSQAALFSILLAIIVPTVLSVYIIVYAFRAAPVVSEKSEYWIASSSIPFAVIYAISSIYCPEILHVVWYLALGLSLLIASTLLETKWAKENKIWAKPYMLSGLLITFLSPAVIYLGLKVQTADPAYLATGLTLIAFCISGTYSIVKAERGLIFERGAKKPS